MTPRVIGTALPVVEIPGLTIRELTGNASTKQDTLSVAHEIISQPMSEPWKTNRFDEWLCVLKGRIEIIHSVDQTLTVKAGETCQVPKNERYRPVFPEANTEFIAICLPAFKPERCIREEEGSLAVSDNPEDSNEEGGNAADGFPDLIYHMCEKSPWEAALSAEEAYFPPTFEKDGGFTHASTEAKSLIATANHFYQNSKDDWICVELSRSALKKLGIATRFEEAKPVGSTPTADHAKSVIYPHIFGGIPASVPGIVKNQYPMLRDASGKFISIEGLQ